MTSTVEVPHSTLVVERRKFSLSTGSIREGLFCRVWHFLLNIKNPVEPKLFEKWILSVFIHWLSPDLAQFPTHFWYINVLKLINERKKAQMAFSKAGQRNAGKCLRNKWMRTVHFGWSFGVLWEAVFQNCWNKTVGSLQYGKEATKRFGADSDVIRSVF